MVDLLNADEAGLGLLRVTERLEDAKSLFGVVIVQLGLACRTHLKLKQI